MNAGFFVFDRRVLGLPGRRRMYSRARALGAARKGRAARRIHHAGFFYAMDTYREYKQLNDLWAAGEAPRRECVLNPRAAVPCDATDAASAQIWKLGEIISGKAKDFAPAELKEPAAT